MLTTKEALPPNSVSFLSSAKSPYFFVNFIELLSGCDFNTLLDRDSFTWSFAVA